MTRSSSLLDGAKTKKRSRSQKKTAVKPGNSEQDGDDADLLAVDNDSFEEEDHENQGTTSTTTTSTSTNIILGPNRCTPLTRPILEANFTKVEHEGEHKDAFEKEWRKHWTHLYKETEKNNLMDVVSTYKEINGLTSSSSEQENNTNTNLDSEIEQDNATNSSRSSLGRRVSPMYLLHGNFLDLAALSANLFTCGKGKTAAVRREYVEGIGYTVVIDPSKVEIVRDAGKMLKKTGSTVNSLLERLNLGEYPQELVEELQAVGDDETNVLVPQGFAMTRADRAVLKTIRSTLDESSKETTEDAEEDAFGGDDAGQQKTKNTLDFSNCNTSIECALEFTKALWASGWDNRTGLILAAHAFKRFTDPTRAEFLYRELDYSTGKPKAKPGYKICSSMVELCIDEPAEYYRLLKQELQDEDMPKSKAVTALKKRVKKLRAEGGADEDIKKEEQADTEEEAGPSGKRKKLS
ncbi:unnamed protein product [Amoebophrya sp. A25]|nr:unnamed protein product [Amoebophrya sp. A25]|eukprot:GSA25T00012408001.1